MDRTGASISSAIQERDQYWEPRRRSTALAVRGKLVHDQGAYAPHSITVPTTAREGPYLLMYNMDVAVADEQAAGHGARAGIRRTFAMERLLDLVADHWASTAVRRRTSFRRPDAYAVGSSIARRSVVLRQRRLRGMPRRWTPRTMRDFRASMAARTRQVDRIDSRMPKATGRGRHRTVRAGAVGHRRACNGLVGIATALAQICADELGVDIENIDVTSAHRVHCAGYRRLRKPDDRRRVGADGRQRRDKA